MGWIAKNIPYLIGGALIAPCVFFGVTMSSGWRVTASSPPLVDDPPEYTVISPTPTLLPTETPTPRPTKTPAPTKTPTPTPHPVTSEQLDEWFTTYSNHYSIERKKLWLMAVCESGLRPNARSGMYGGLYQFSESTWRSTRIQMNADTDPQLRFNPEEAIRTAAFKISTSGLSAWPSCNKAE